MSYKLRNYFISDYSFTCWFRYCNNYRFKWFIIFYSIIYSINISLDCYWFNMVYLISEKK